MDVCGELLRALELEYDVIRTVKQSARGEVSVVRHRKTGRRFVFRLFDGSGEVYERLIPVVCPHLPQIMEAAERDGKTAVLEEYVQGDTLSFLLEGGLIEPKTARKIVWQLCAGLWVLHSLGAVHRDVKPENVILRGDEAVLIDFDASRIHKWAQNADTQVLGTTGFAAPEQYGLSQTDGRADIYSLGVLLNIMVTGEHPSVTLAKGRLGKIVHRCTAMNPEKRYQSVLDLMETL